MENTNELYKFKNVTVSSQYELFDYSDNANIEINLHLESEGGVELILPCYKFVVDLYTGVPMNLDYFFNEIIKYFSDDVLHNRDYYEYILCKVGQSAIRKWKEGDTI